MNLLAWLIDWQTAGAGVIVLVAAVYLARRAWLTLRGRRAAGCGTCPTCPVEGGPEQPPLVTLESLAASGRREALDAKL
ncbi:MAG: hypothetical protein AB7U73_12440 [Pirellulales bacterium]